MSTSIQKRFTTVLWLVGTWLLSTTQVIAETYYFHNDHLGTPQVLTDETQTVVWQGEYDPFGQATETVATVEQNLRFPGQYLDRESGLHYNYFRTYDPAAGRYTQPDPIGLDGGINTYGYAYQNPQSYIDPTGLFVPLVISGICAAGACEAIFVASGAIVIWWGTNNPWSTELDDISFPNIYNSEVGDGQESCPSNDEENWERIPGSNQAYKPVGGKEPIFEKDRSRGNSHGGSAWKKWDKANDWQKNRRRDGTYSADGRRLRD